jgi:LmeA-like phospholipid-binding
MGDQGGSSAGRALLIIVGILLALILGADIAARSVAAARVAASLQRALGLPEEPDIHLSGFPFALHLARGRFEEVGVQVTQLEADGLTVDRAVLDLRDVRFPRRALVLGGGGDVIVEGGRAEAEISDEALTAFLETEGVPASVEFLGPKVEVTPAETGATVRGRLRLDQGTLGFRAEASSELGFQVALPELLPGLRYRHVSVGEDTAVISADLAGATFELVD